MLKIIGIIFIISTLAFPAASQVVVELPQASQRIGLTDVEVDYARPAVNGRKIWGDVVPFGFTLPTVDGKDQAPWKTGANMNTTLSFTHDVRIESQPVKAGKYGFFVAVHPDGTATVVLSRTYQAYGQYFYRQEDDVLRATVTTRATAPTEWLTFAFDDVGARHAVLSLKWETKEIPVRIDVDVIDIVRASLVEQLKQPATFTWHGRVQAVRYLLDNNVHLDLALQWINEALEGSPGGELLTGERNFTTLTTKYHVLNALNREAEAAPFLDEALAKPVGVTPARAVSFATNLLKKNRQQDAQRVFVWAARQWPDSWEAQHGLARWHSSQGNYKEALKLERAVLTRTPEDQKAAITANIQLLEHNQDFNQK